MNTLILPRSSDELSERLRTLHSERKNLVRPPRRLSLTSKQRKIVRSKTDGRCHLCGGDMTESKFAVGHVVAHAAGGQSFSDNYLGAHGNCNGSRWDYSPEEIQWILKMGVWARKKMEDRTPIGVKMIEPFYQGERATRERRRVGGTTDLAGSHLIALRTI